MKKQVLRWNRKYFYSIDMKIHKHYNDFYEKSKEKIDLVVLNTPNFPFFFKELWNRSSIKICADGGSNRLYTYSKE